MLSLRCPLTTRLKCASYDAVLGLRKEICIRSIGLGIICIDTVIDSRGVNKITKSECLERREKRLQDSALEDTHLVSVPWIKRFSKANVEEPRALVCHNETWNGTLVEDK